MKNVYRFTTYKPFFFKITCIKSEKENIVGTCFYICFMRKSLLHVAIPVVYRREFDNTTVKLHIDCIRARASKHFRACDLGWAIRACVRLTARAFDRDYDRKHDEGFRSSCAEISQVRRPRDVAASTWSCRRSRFTCAPACAESEVRMRCMLNWRETMRDMIRVMI